MRGWGWGGGEGNEWMRLRELVCILCIYGVNLDGYDELM